jgi:hypothetical protein
LVPSSQPLPFPNYINTLLLECSQFHLHNHQQPNYDSSLRSQSCTASIVDNTSIALPYDDLPFFLKIFSELGHSLGIQLVAFAKTHILSSITRESPHISYTKDPWNYSLEVTTGIHFLGYPLG